MPWENRWYPEQPSPCQNCTNTATRAEFPRGWRNWPLGCHKFISPFPSSLPGIFPRWRVWVSRWLKNKIGFNGNDTPKEYWIQLFWPADYAISCLDICFFMILLLLGALKSSYARYYQIEKEYLQLTTLIWLIWDDSSLKFFFIFYWKSINEMCSFRICFLVWVV